MRIHQNSYHSDYWAQPLEFLSNAQIVFLFGNRHIINDETIQNSLRQYFPKAEYIGRTTAGEIHKTHIFDDSLTLTAIEFSATEVMVTSCDINQNSLSDTVVNLAATLSKNNLKYVIVLSDGQCVNSSELVRTINTAFPPDVKISGGLAADSHRFEETMVWRNGSCQRDKLLLCGFYGERIRISYGSESSWEAFGPLRCVEKSNENVLFVLDNNRALDLYKKYLGDYAQRLPASALLFPLKLTNGERNEPVVRTILKVNEDDGSMTFAGDLPQGSKVQLMRANLDHLIDSAANAAEQAYDDVQMRAERGVGLLVSCVGRRVILKHRCEEELESVAEIMGNNWALTGFYSYGEISPCVTRAGCHLTNQTMAITLISEDNA